MTEKVVVVKTRRGSGPRVVGRQFRSRSKHGRVAFDAASKVGTQLVAGWVKSIIDGFRGFAEIKGGR
ncbi:hypothetical protein LH407_10130 [Antiquaquibacter oligotrophicus]|nr:hypothetical protein [Antiquaquibacter oligotrophicus]UDF12508.1 hypothetical protein LH407_10130 [Antiquaquibacter oligotrophicus]